MSTDVGVDVIGEPDLDLGVPAVSEQVAECVRIESGRPRLGYDMDAETMPQEAGINERAVSFTKGCYVGQETVARLHYRGKPNRHLRGLRLPEPVERGSEILLGDKVVGRVGVDLRLAALRADRARARAPRGGAGRQRERERCDGRAGRVTVHAWLNAGPPTSRSGLSRESPLLGYDPRGNVLDMPPMPEPVDEPGPDLRELRRLVPAAEPGREVDDWGRSQRVFDLVEPLLDFYYRYWFRVEVEGIENVPAEGGALIVSNHSGALPPDAPMIIAGDPLEHSAPRPVYMLGEHWFKGYPGRVDADQQDRAWWPPTPRTPSGCCATSSGSRSSSRRARRAPASSTGSATGCGASGAAASSAPRCARASRSSRSR